MSCNTWHDPPSPGNLQNTPFQTSTYKGDHTLPLFQPVLFWSGHQCWGCMVSIMCLWQHYPVEESRSSWRLATAQLTLPVWCCLLAMNTMFIPSSSGFSPWIAVVQLVPGTPCFSRYDFTKFTKFEPSRVAPWHGNPRNYDVMMEKGCTRYASCIIINFIVGVCVYSQGKIDIDFASQPYNGYTPSYKRCSIWCIQDVVSYG